MEFKKLVVGTAMCFFVGMSGVALADNAGFPNGNDRTGEQTTYNTVNRGGTGIGIGIGGQGGRGGNAESSSVAVAVGGQGGSAKVERGAVQNSVNTIVGGQKTIVGGQKTTVGGQKTDIRIEGDQREFLDTPNVAPYETPLLQNGRVGDVTKSMPKFKGIMPLDMVKDTIVKVIKVNNGHAFNRIRLEDVEEAIFETMVDIKAGKYGMVDVAKVRYQLFFKDSAVSSGVGGGFAGNGSDVTSGGTAVGGTLSVLPGTHRSTADPAYTVKWFEVE